MSLLLWTSLLTAAYSPLEGIQWECIDGSGRGRIDVVVGAGGLNEQDDARGVAHLLEHLVFRSGNFAYRHENGATGFDYTHYHRADGDLIGAAIPLLKELKAPTFRPDDLSIERNVVIKELDERGAGRGIAIDPRFGRTPLSRAIGGTPQDVRGLRLEDVMAFHAKFYVKGNIAVRFSNARDCKAVEEAVQPIFSDWPPGPAAEVVKVVEKEPGPVTLPSPDFSVGYFWYAASPQERILWVAVAEHLKLGAYRELRQNRGLVYSPQMMVRHLGPGGLFRLSMNVEDNAREAARWFDETIAALKAEPNVTADLSDALNQAGQWLTENPEVEALAAIRGQQPPRKILTRFKKNVPRPLLERMLIDRRRFGSALPQTNILTYLILAGCGLGVLAFLRYVVKELT